jgi:hypothetical protein
MNDGKSIGMIIFVAGLCIIIGYGLYEGFQELTLENIDIIIAIGAAAIVIGLLILFISIIMEQRIGTKKMKRDIKKEDLEP